MKGLRALGYRIAIGDIGAGNSGLGSLALVEPDAVKLDMSVIARHEEFPGQAEAHTRHGDPGRGPGIRRSSPRAWTVKTSASSSPASGAT